MRRKLSVLILAVVILLQVFSPAVFAASKNEFGSQTVSFCSLSLTSEGTGKAVETKALQTYYPPNNGFLGSPSKATLQPGTTIDRFGSKFGNYASPVGTPIEMRSLPPSTFERPYSVYEVVKPVDALSGRTAPWFSQPGLGTQYKFDLSFEEMLQSGILRKVGE